MACHTNTRSLTAYRSVSLLPGFAQPGHRALHMTICRKRLTCFIAAKVVHSPASMWLCRARITDLFHVCQVVYCAAIQQGRCLRQVGCDNSCQRKQMFLHGCCNFTSCQGVSTCGHKHWVYNQLRNSMGLHHVCNSLDCLQTKCMQFGDRC